MINKCYTHIAHSINFFLIFLDQSLNEINPIEYQHNPYIPLDKLPDNIDYFSSQDALLPGKYGAPNPDKFEPINLIPNDIENFSRRKRESVTVILAESFAGINENSSFIDMVITHNRTEYKILENNTEIIPDTTTYHPVTTETETQKITDSDNEWSSLIIDYGSDTDFSSQDWTPQKFPVPGSIQNLPVQKTDSDGYDVDRIKQQIEENKSNLEKNRDKNMIYKIPHFHVTYWMFYPYSQGKTMCSISLGPLGRIPIPLIFGICLGTRKDFGSHVGDWEHMSLHFKGRAEPDVRNILDKSIYN